MANIGNKSQNFTAIVLAASRGGPEDSVAQIQSKSHKCLVSLNGSAMIQRVIQAILDTPQVKRIFVSIDDPSALLEIPQVAALMDHGSIEVLTSKGTISESLVAATKEIENPYPLIVTAGDNALHTAEMLEFFCKEINSGEADAYIAMTDARLTLKKYPQGRRAFHQLKDGAYSSCNLYGVTSTVGLRGARPFATGGQFGKKPWRIAIGFGLWSLLLYKMKWITLEGVAKRISRLINGKASVVLMPWAEGPIDVDNPQDYALVTNILKGREGDKE